MFLFFCDASECQDTNTSTLTIDKENQSLFCRQHDDSVTIEIVYLYQGLLVEQFSDVMESPCEGTAEETMLDTFITS